VARRVRRARGPAAHDTLGHAVEEHTPLAHALAEPVPRRRLHDHLRLARAEVEVRAVAHGVGVRALHHNELLGQGVLAHDTGDDVDRGAELRGLDRAGGRPLACAARVDAERDAHRRPRGEVGLVRAPLLARRPPGRCTTTCFGARACSRTTPATTSIAAPSSAASTVPAGVPSPGRRASTSSATPTVVRARRSAYSATCSSNVARPGSIRRTTWTP